MLSYTAQCCIIQRNAVYAVRYCIVQCNTASSSVVLYNTRFLCRLLCYTYNTKLCYTLTLTLLPSIVFSSPCTPTKWGCLGSPIWSLSLQSSVSTGEPGVDPSATLTVYTGALNTGEWSFESSISTSSCGGGYAGRGEGVVRCRLKNEKNCHIGYKCKEDIFCHHRS